MLFLQDLDYLIYSSHKTATQSLLSIFKANEVNSKHCHYIEHLRRGDKSKIKTYAEMKKAFIDDLNEYKKYYNKKINIVSIIRNPIDRLPSSFFQTHHTDEISFFKKEEQETTVSKNTIEELILIFIDKIKNKKLRGGVESIDEMSHIFQVDIISMLKYNNYYYYFENELINLFVLDFNKIISDKNLEYLHKCLGLNLTKNSSANLSSQKIYYEKYKEFKKVLPSIENILKSNYNIFYFEAFNK